VSGLLEYWSHPAEFGEQLLSALTAYYEVFFAEEERRIRPILDSELARAQDLATQLDFGSLVETLSQGVRLSYQHQKPEAVLIPSYWGAPFLFFGMADPDKEMLLFGARPKAASLVPGESVPDALVNALKSLADPTRLRILRYLVSEPLTPTQLARRLRLRAPTVIHHLHALRAAGLVYVMVGEGKEKAYQSRQEGILATCDMLSEFLENSEAAED
jgi:DNA-binding transcriptional ArsR family regulator